MSAAIKLSAVAMMLSVGIVSALPATRHGRIMVGPPRPAVPEGVPARTHQTLHPHAAMCLRGGDGDGGEAAATEYLPPIDYVTGVGIVLLFYLIVEFPEFSSLRGGACPLGLPSAAACTFCPDAACLYLQQVA